MNVLSVLPLALNTPTKPTAAELKQGKPDHSDKIFVNKAAQIDEFVKNDEAGMKVLGETILASLNELAGRTFYLIGKGQTNPETVANGMIAGKVYAYQYHNDKYDDPSWKISLGFVADVKRKNAGYKSNAGDKAPKRVTTLKRAKRGLIS